ncbi:MAG: alpha/beta hydrolase, partial [Asgard group archaeon]|nr:alpha/beta hydrolase [Asgard group archaeon]
MQTQELTIDNITFRYLDLPAENETADTIILIHYGGGTLACWNGIIPYLENKYRIVAFDLRGHGYSSKPDSEYTLEIFTKDILNIMDELNIPKAHFVGCSLGAYISVYLAANHGHRVKSLILDGAYYDYLGPDSKKQIITKKAKQKERKEWEKQFSNLPHNKFEDKEELIGQTKEFFEQQNLWTEELAFAIKDNICKTAEGKFTQRTPPAVTYKYCMPLLDICLEKMFKKISCQVIFLLTEKDYQDRIIQDNILKYMHLVPFGTMSIFRGAIHPYTALMLPEEY